MKAEFLTRALNYCRRKKLIRRFATATGAATCLSHPCPPRTGFPPPWSVEETDACFIVRDANGLALALLLLLGRAKATILFASVSTMTARDLYG